MALIRSGVTFKSNRDVKELTAALLKVADVEVLAGFPEDTTDRPPEDGVPSNITNASLAYIHDQGAPESNIPARPFMCPAMEAVKDRIADKMGQILKAAINDAGSAKMAQGFTQLGIIAKLSIQKTINAGIDPALAESTLRARARKGRKGAQKELDNRAKGLAPSTLFAKPLVDTGELRDSASYAIRSRKRRR
jgi:hypothetical protein